MIGDGILHSLYPDGATNPRPPAVERRRCAPYRPSVNPRLIAAAASEPSDGLRRREVELMTVVVVGMTLRSGPCSHLPPPTNTILPDDSVLLVTIFCRSSFVPPYEASSYKSCLQVLPARDSIKTGMGYSYDIFLFSS